MHRWKLEDDLYDIMDSSLDSLKILDNSQILLTGCTGFIGIWLLNTLNEACIKNNINIKIFLVSRNKHIKEISSILVSELTCNLKIKIITSDIRNFETYESFDYVIHGAVDTSVELNNNEPDEMHSTIMDGTKNLLKQLRHSKSLQKILHLSSGAVYGKTTSDEPLKEILFLDEPIKGKLATYAESKRLSESLINTFSNNYNIPSVHARIFAVCGPFMKFDAHFAFGNFIRDALFNKKIIIKSDGASVRSFLYASDMIKWLVYLLIGETNFNSYNIGSSESISIKNLASKISNIMGCSYEVQNKSITMWDNKYYIPNIDRIIEESKINPFNNLDKSIIKTSRWKQNESKII